MRVAVVQIGALRLTGRAAVAATLALLVAILAALIYFRARILSSPLSISAALWIAFVVNWSVAASKTASAPTQSAATTVSSAGTDSAPGALPAYESALEIADQAGRCEHNRVGTVVRHAAASDP